MQFTARLTSQDRAFVHAENPLETRRPQTPTELLDCLQWIEDCQQKGLWVGGYFSYEAGKAFDPSHATKKDKIPLAILSAYDKAQYFDASDLPQGKMPAEIKLAPHIDKQAYEKALRKTLNYIKNGDIYQANLSFRCDVEIEDVKPYDYFCALYQRHPVPYAAFCDSGDIQISSLSPELFIKRRGSKIISDPMKGTCPRGRSYQEDLDKQQELQGDIKTRAENVMIVDLMRNDISRIANTGSVKVPELFKVSPFRSLFQMTSRVEAESSANLSEIMQATYPPGSITGAPKIRAMEVIEELENDARGVYTGSLAWFEPNGDFTMNVGIRTLVFCDGKAELGLGSGVVADSDKWPEWEECLLKGDFLKAKPLPNEIFETLLCENSSLQNLSLHMHRLRNSCRYFQRPFPRREIFAQIRQTCQLLPRDKKIRFRLAINTKAEISITHAILEENPQAKKSCRVYLSPKKLDKNNLFLYHKTSERALYNEEFQKAQENHFDEAIFTNNEGEVCEGCISNIIIENKAGERFTPALTSGLLPGIWRQTMLDKKLCREKSISINDIKQARRIIIGNSLRGEREVSEIIDHEGNSIFNAIQEGS